VQHHTVPVKNPESTTRPRKNATEKPRLHSHLGAPPPRSDPARRRPAAMSQPTAAVAAEAQPQGRGLAGRQGGGGGLGQSISGIVRMAVFWYFAAKFFGPKRPPADPGILMSNLFQKGEPMVRTPSVILIVSGRDFGSKRRLRSVDVCLSVGSGSVVRVIIVCLL
jgi:hypothetical protein